MADGQMSGKIVMVTGATSGIGLATAEALARQGAHVVLGARNAGKAEKVVAGLRAALPPEAGGSLDVLAADLSLLAGVRGLAAAFCERYDRLDVLVNNAGGMFTRRQDSAEGLELTWALNYLSPFLLTHLLLDQLAAAAPARIVNVSSTMQAQGKLAFDDLQGERRYNGLAAYSQAKLALIMFTYELARRVRAKGVTVNVLHPGLVASNFYANAGGMMKLAGPLMGLFSLSVADGARTSIYLAASPDVAGVTGKYFIKCAPAKSNPISYDQDALRRVWDAAAQVTGVGRDV